MSGEQFPRVTDNVHVTPVGDELLVHIADSTDTHLLGASVARVWGRCDGETARTDLVDVFAAEPEEHRLALVDVALDELAAAGLIASDLGVDEVARQSRRRFLRRAAVAAVVIPTITTIATVTPAAAQSAGDACTTDGNCDPGLVCNGAIGGGTCQPPQGVGGPCLEAADCEPGRTCTLGLCV